MSCSVEYIGNESNKTPIKAGVADLFTSNPELAEIGTQEQYSAYLETIFHDSKVKDIVYHGTDALRGKSGIDKEGFKKPNRDRLLGGKNQIGIFFTDKENASNFSKDLQVDLAEQAANRFEDTLPNEYKEQLRNTSKPILIPAIINASNPINLTRHELQKQWENLPDKVNSVLVTDLSGKYGYEKVVFEPEQIHILGSKQDIKGFKEFVREKQPTEKEKFNKLKEELGQYNALQSIAGEGKTTYSEEGFVSAQEKTDRVNAVFGLIVNEILADTEIMNAVELLDYEEDLQLGQVIHKVKMSIETLVREASLEHSNGVNVEENAHKAARGVVMLKNFDHLVKKALKKLNTLGVKLDKDFYSEADNTPDSSEEKQMADKELIYGRGHLETSRLDSVRVQIKLFLATLGNKTLERNGELTPVLDDLGFEVPSSFAESFHYLASMLANTSTYEKMLVKLEEASESNALVNQVYNSLINEKAEQKLGDRVELKGEKILSFRNSFYSSFRNSLTESVTANFKVNKAASKKASQETEQNVVILENAVYDSNSRGTEKIIQNEWFRDNATLYSNSSSDQKLALWNTGKISNLLSAEHIPNLAARLDNKNDMEVLKNVRVFLGTMGISVSINALSTLRRSRKFNSSNKFSSFVIGSPKSGISILNLGTKFWAKGVNISQEETSTFKYLAKIEATNRKNKDGGSYTNDEGNQVHPLNLPTSLSDMIDEISNKEERFEVFKADPLLSQTRLMKLADESNDKYNNLVLKKLGSLYNGDGKGNKATVFDKFSPISATATKLIMSVKPDAKGNPDARLGAFMTATPSDKSNTSLLIVPKLRNTGWVNGKLFEGDFKDWAISFAKMEYSRIIIAREEIATLDPKQLVKDYHTGTANGTKFNYFPKLNTLLESKNFDINSAEVKAVIEEQIKEQFELDLEYLKSIHFVTSGSTLEKMQFTKPVKSMVAAKFLTAQHVQALMANSFWINNESSLLFTGDLAMFSGEPGSRAQSEKANKRVGLMETPGTKPFVGPGGMKETYNCAVLKDVMVSAGDLDFIEGVLGKEKASNYRNINSTDGGGLATSDRYLDLMAGLGTITQDLIDTVRELDKPRDQVNPAKLKVTIMTVKGFVSVMRYNETFKRVMPTVIKYAVLPIGQAMYAENSTMRKVHQKMLKSKTDEAVFLSTMKFGAHNINTIEQEEDFTNIVVSNKDYRIPTHVPEKIKAEINDSSQKNKILTASAQPDVMYTLRNGQTLSGSEMIADYQRAKSINLEEDFNKFANSIVTDGKIDVQKIAKKIISDLEKNDFKSIPDSLLEAMEIVLDKDGNLDTKIPLDFPTIKHLVESTLTSGIRREVIKQKVPGFVGVQYTSLGYDKKAIETDTNLKYVREEVIDGQPTGRILPAEVIVSPKYFIQVLEKMPQTDEVKYAIRELKSGNFNLENISEGLREIVAYRIPYQGTNSTLPCKIVAFTPVNSGDIIVCPAELVTQAGIDFDIDKLYIQAKHFTIKGGMLKDIQSDVNGDRKQRDNLLMDTHLAILLHQNHLKSLLTPNGAEDLKVLKEYIESVYPENNFGIFGGLSTQDKLRESNRAGGLFIGIVSDYSTLHAVMSDVGGKVTSRHKHSRGSSVIIDGKSAKSGEKSTVISSLFESFQTAALDAANDPILSALNINEITGSTAMWLVSSGASAKYITYLMNAPIIRKLVEHTTTNEVLYGSEGAFNAAVDEALEDFGLEVDMQKELQFKDFDISMGRLEELYTDLDSKSLNLLALKAFLTFRTYGKDLEVVKAAFKIDTKGPKQSATAVYLQQMQLGRVKGTQSYSESNPMGTVASIEVNPEAFAKHQFGALERIIQRTGNMLDIIGIAGNKELKDVINNYVVYVNASPSEKELRLLSTAFLSYIMTNKHSTSERFDNPISNELDTDFLASLLSGENSLGRQIIAMQKLEESKRNANNSYRANQFLASITVELNTLDGFDLVKGNYSTSRALTSEQKSDIAEDFLRLYNNPETATIAEDLMWYALGTEGFNRGTNSFSEFIHPDMFTELISQEGNSAVDFYREVKKKLRSGEVTINKDQFLETFILNTTAELIIPTIKSKEYSQVVKDMGKLKGKYFKLTDGSICVKTDKDTYGVIGQSEGIKNVLSTFVPGSPLSGKESIIEAKERAKALKEAQVTNC